jgi:lipocalin
MGPLGIFLLVVAIVVVVALIGYWALLTYFSRPNQPDKDIRDAIVPYMDPKEFFNGRWYEYERIDSWFQKPSSRYVTADYYPMDDGRVRVVNADRSYANGPVRHLRVGTGYGPRDHSGSFQVEFAHPFRGAYNVIGYSDDHRAAVVCDDHRKYLWFLQRDQKTNSPYAKWFRTTAKKAGFTDEQLDAMTPSYD